MDEAQRRIVIRRPRKVKGKHHGGSWKIALADLMTALMALFLVLWLLSSASPAELKNVAEYFRTPLSVALAGGDKDMASTSAIPGGGPDPSHNEGETMRVDKRTQSRSAETQRRFVALRRRIESVVSANPELRGMKDNIRFNRTPQGLRVQLVDTETRSMFELGSDKVAPQMRKLLHALAPIINDLPNRISINGHTDSIPYASGVRDYSNWELSSDRANASRRELVAAGLDDQKLLRVTGMGDRVPFPGSRPGDPVNRRITLLVLSENAASLIRSRMEPLASGRSQTDGGGNVLISVQSRPLPPWSAGG